MEADRPYGTPFRYVDGLLQGVDGDYRHHRAKISSCATRIFGEQVAKHSRRVEPALRVEATVQAISPGQ